MGCTANAPGDGSPHERPRAPAPHPLDHRHPEERSDDYAPEAERSTKTSAPERARAERG